MAKRILCRKITLSFLKLAITNGLGGPLSAVSLSAILMNHISAKRFVTILLSLDRVRGSKY
jgi:hypothetical protein